MHGSAWAEGREVNRNMPALPPLPVRELPGAVAHSGTRAVALRSRVVDQEWLPFTIEVVRGESVQRALADLHSPPPATGTEPSACVLLARSKLDGSALGAIQVQTNALAPLPLETSVRLPPALRSARLAQATPLQMDRPEGRSLVKMALFKALFLHCTALEVEFLVVHGGAPSDRQYERLLFTEILPGAGPALVRSAGPLPPRRVFQLDLRSAARTWQRAGHPLWGFLVRTVHPDIHVGRRDAWRRAALN